MSRDALKRYALLALIVGGVSIALSAIWQVPFIFTAIGFCTWAFVGHVITADDDIKGGWSNPDGSIPFPWCELALKALVLAGLWATVIFVPAARTFGGT